MVDAKFKVSSIMAVLLFAPATIAGQLTITNTFTANSPALADEVNQNFSDVKAAVDDNDGRISANAADIAANVTAISNNSASIAANASAIASAFMGYEVVDASGNAVGNLIGASQIQSAVIISASGYRANVNLTLGNLESILVPGIYYTSTDCTGPSYLEVGGDVIPTGTVMGQVINHPSYQGHWYVPVGSPEVTLTMNSIMGPDGICTSSGVTLPVTTTVKEYLPNDVAITGIANTFNLPLVIRPR